jgi:hypothetical protein
MYNVWVVNEMGWMGWLVVWKMEADGGAEGGLGGV